MTTSQILQEVSSYLDEDLLLHPIEIKEIDKMPTDAYIDNGRSDIVTGCFDKPIKYEGHSIVAFTLIDKYLYGRENQTSKKNTVTLYYLTTCK
jgi:hypothetical protein